MEISTTESNGISVVSPAGRVDSSTAHELEAALKALYEGGKTQIVLDLEKVDFMSSMGLRVLVSAHKAIDAAGGGFRLCNLSDNVDNLLLLVGMHEIFDIQPDQAAALESF